jgi:hypothetical protein
MCRMAKLMRFKPTSYSILTNYPLFLNHHFLLVKLHSCCDQDPAFHHCSRLFTTFHHIFTIFHQPKSSGLTGSSLQFLGFPKSWYPLFSSLVILHFFPPSSGDPDYGTPRIVHLEPSIRCQACCTGHSRGAVGSLGAPYSDIMCICI